MLTGRRFTSEQEIHDFLRQERREEDELHALSILCQGYLAVHAATTGREGSQPGHEGPVSAALERMGWPTLVKEASDILDLERLRQRRREVRGPDWWRAVFPQRPAESTLGHAGATEAVRGLLGAIYREGGEEIQAETVARAYLELSKPP